MVQTLLETGTRVSEFVALRVEDVGLGERTITVESGKGAKRREIPIRAELARLLSMHIGTRRAGPLFLSRQKDRSGSRTYTRQRIGQMVREVARDAGITKRLYPHLLRHYIDCMTMSGTTGWRAVRTGDRGSAGDRPDPSTRHSFVDLQAVEKAEQPISGLVTAGLAGGRCCLGQCPFFHCQRRLQIDLGGLDGFVSEPQRDHRAVDACL